MCYVLICPFRTTLCVGVMMAPGASRLSSDGLHATWTVGRQGRVRWWDIEGVTGQQIASVVAHLAALQVVAEGGGANASYGVVLEGGELEIPEGGGPGWACMVVRFA